MSSREQPATRVTGTPAERSIAAATAGWRWVLFLLFAGYLLFAHGCHGDEDNELFAVLRGAGWLPN